MAYLRQYQMRGDPFLGGLLKGALRVVKGAAGAALGISKPQVIAMPGGAAIGAAAGKVGKVLGKVPKGVKIGAGAAAGGIAAGVLGSRVAGMMGEGRRYRRMNPGNVKALRRSMRRVTSFAKLARSVMSFTKTHRIKKRRR